MAPDRPSSSTLGRVPSPEASTGDALEPAPRSDVSLFSVLRRRALIIVAVTLLCGGAAAAFVLLSDDTYESTSKLLFRQGIGPELNALGLNPNTVDAENLSGSNVELVDSRRTAVATSEALARRGWDISPEDVDEDVAVAGTRQASDVVHITAEASSAGRAALLANTYALAARDLARADDRRQIAAAARNVRDQLRQLGERQAERRARPRPRGRPAPEAPEAAVAAADRLRANTERLRTLAAVGTGSPRVIQPGYVPSSESGRPVETIVLGLLFGLLLGAGLALLREQADRRLHRAEEVSAAFDAPVLATVPRNRALKRHVPFPDLPPEVAEAFRMLHMNLRYRQGDPVRSVVVTSSRSEQGKTTVAWNLACAAASSGLSVALVETDMRRPRLAERYGLDRGPGLAEVLREEMQVVDALQAVPLSVSTSGNGRPGHSGLHVLVAGEPPHDPWALIQSARMDRVLNVLKLNHDLVVLDTPPIPYVADALPLLRRVDGVVVTASVRSIGGPEAARLRDQLDSLDARILGVVANGESSANGYTYAAVTPSAGRSSG